MAHKRDLDKAWAALTVRLARALGRQPLSLEEAERLYGEAEEVPLSRLEVDALIADVLLQLQLGHVLTSPSPALDLLYSADAIFLHPADVVDSEIVYHGTELVADFDSISVDAQRAVAPPHFARRWGLVPGTASVSVDVCPDFYEHDGSSLRNVRQGTLCWDAYLDNRDSDWVPRPYPL